VITATRCIRPAGLSLLAVLAVASLSRPVPAQVEEGPGGAVAAGAGRARASLPVRVDPRVELMSIIFRLAGNSEYCRGRVAGYTKDVDEHFGKFRDHEVVQTARSLRRVKGVSYDAVMSMAVHMKDTTTLEEAVPFEPRPETLEPRWEVRSARRFLREAREFVKVTKFQAFLDAHRDLYATATKRMQAVLDKDLKPEWFDAFFGARPAARFQLALGMLNGPCCYAARLRHPDGKEDIHCILGVWETDGDGLPCFDRSMLGTVAHEFAHSYCNPLVDKHADALEAPAKTLWPFVADAMRSQAYSNWKTMMYESLVRASVVRYQAYARGDAVARKQAGIEDRRRFHWVGELAERLAHYEKTRQEYRTLDDFMPEVAAFYAQYAKKFAERMARAPKVVSIVPENGARDVDPATDRIVVTFDRPMRDGCWAVVKTGAPFPEIRGKLSFDPERKVLTIPVQLEPNTRYEYWLNRGRFMAFQSEDGVQLRPVRVRFQTAK